MVTKEMTQQELNQRRSTAPEGWHRDICQGIIMAYFLVIALIYPFYAPGGYLRIGEVKYEFFRNVSLVTLAVMAAVIVLAIILRRDGEWILRYYQGMSVTDWFAYGYFIAVMLSYLCSAYKQDALWGVEGWHMGTVTQMIFVLIYFFFSRYFHRDLRWIGVWLAAAAGVFLLGICNRYSVYPIMMEGQTETFISTLGNINWFCGYWSVTAPIGITLYWCSGKIWVRVLAAVYSVIAMLAGVTQGSGSAYIVFLVLLMFLFILSLGNGRRIYRFLELCMLFAGSCLLGKFMYFLPSLQYNYMPTGGDKTTDITAALLTGNAALWILLCVLICYVFLKISERWGLLHIGSYMEAHRGAKRTIAAATAVSACIGAVILLIAGGAFHTDETAEMSYDSSYRQIFNEDWGHGRGTAWDCGINAYRNMNVIQKTVGVGPDCFADYAYDIPELADKLITQFGNQRLTNAHNEQLTLLVDVGVLGWICYAGLLASAFIRFMRRASGQPALYLCAAAALAYTAHNMVSFQQILSTPFVFIALGIGESFCRNTAEEEQMNDESAETNHREERTANKGLKITGQLAEYLLTVMAVILCVVMPFYAKDGYHKIGDAKFSAYRNIMMTGCSILLAVTVLYFLFWMREHRKLRISATDGCVLAYLVITGISVVSGGFYGDVLWGYKGWNMGLLSQISFVLLYLFLSRFGKYYRFILTVLCAAACVVYIIGLLHRLLIDPIGFYDGLTNNQKAQFLSTLGQNTWYGSFLAVTLPVGVGVFLYIDRKAWRIIGGIFMICGFCTLVTQNSDSAYFGLAGALLVFFMVSAQERGMMCRFMGALTLLFASGKVMYYLMQINPNPELQADFVTRLMWKSPVTWILLVVCLFITVLLYVMGHREGFAKYPTALMFRLRRIVPVTAAAVIAVVALMIVLQTRGVLPAEVSDGLSQISYFNWNDAWGNGRGRIWRFSTKMFSEEDIVRKLFGVGPDGFHSYVAARYSEEQALLWGNKQLTNAHNEWLNMLINGGIIGTIAYLGIYVTAVYRFYCGRKQNILLAGIAAACVSYMCYNFFCYQQVLCTPFIFLLIGIGEYMIRESSDKEKSAV